MKNIIQISFVKTLSEYKQFVKELSMGAAVLLYSGSERANSNF